MQTIKLKEIMTCLALSSGLGQGAFANESATSTFIQEARLGIMQHNICVVDCKNANKEDGPDLQLELVFKPPKFLNVLKSPRPYIMGSLNTAGKTSFVGVGLNWEFKLSEKFSLEPGFGYTIHDGAIDPPYPLGDPRNTTFSEDNVLLGSEDLFRSSLALEREITPKLSGQLIIEHLSHGQILGSGRNQSMNNLGVRLAWRF